MSKKILNKISYTAGYLSAKAVKRISTLLWGAKKDGAAFSGALDPDLEEQIEDINRRVAFI